MSESQIFGIIAIGAFVAYMIWGSGGQSQSKIRIEENRKKKELSDDRMRAENTASDLALIDQAQALLPDHNGFLKQLRIRFHWSEIAEAGGLYAPHIEILKSIPFFDWGNLTLPNIRSRYLSAIERRFLAAVRAEHQGDRDFMSEARTYGVEALTGLPTVSALEDLVNDAFVIAKNPDFPEGRIFHVSLTVAGRNLLTLESVIQSEQEHGYAQIRSLASPEVRVHLRRAVRSALFDSGILGRENE